MLCSQLLITINKKGKPTLQFCKITEASSSLPVREIAKDTSKRKHDYYLVDVVSLLKRYINKKNMASLRRHASNMTQADETLLRNHVDKFLVKIVRY